MCLCCNSPVAALEFTPDCPVFCRGCWFNVLTCLECTAKIGDPPNLDELYEMYGEDMDELAEEDAERMQRGEPVPDRPVHMRRVAPHELSEEDKEGVICVMCKTVAHAYCAAVVHEGASYCQWCDGTGDVI